MSVNLRNDPNSFAQFYRKQISDAVKDAAGKDHRLSKNEAKEIRESHGELAKPIEDYFEATQSQSVSVDKIVDIAARRAGKAAEKAIKNGAIEPESLPGHLAQVFLRGAKTVPARTGELSFNQLRQTALDFVKDKVANQRGWQNIEEMESFDATEDWYWGSRVGVENRVGEGNAMKIDFALFCEKEGREQDVSIGVALDKRSGDILEIYIGREGASSPGDY